MRVAITIIALLLVTAADGQSNFKFHSQNYIGALGGERDAAFQFQSINGFQKQTWFGGIGTGLDYYYNRTVPLFLSFSKYLNTRASTPYVSLDGGTNFTWDNSTGNSINGYRDDGHFTPSLYYGVHIGYKSGLKSNKGSVIIAAGFSAKRMKEKFSVDGPCTDPPCPDHDEVIDYKFNRFSFKLGWLF